MMTTPFGTIPPLRYTDQVAMKAAQTTDIEVTNVAVRTTDRAAFLAVIAAREAQLTIPRDPACSQAGRALEIATFAREATETLTTDCPRELAIAQLETVAALTIDLLADLKGKEA